jgi:hypothetical protein
MSKRKRGLEIITPPHGVTIPEGHNEITPKPVRATYQRVLWIVADKYVDPQLEGWERYSIAWVLTDRDGNVKATYTGKRSTLPALFKKYLEA